MQRNLRRRASRCRGRSAPRWTASFPARDPRSAPRRRPSSGPRASAHCRSPAPVPRDRCARDLLSTALPATPAWRGRGTPCPRNRDVLQPGVHQAHGKFIADRPIIFGEVPVEGQDTASERHAMRIRQVERISADANSVALWTRGSRSSEPALTPLNARLSRSLKSVTWMTSIGSPAPMQLAPRHGSVNGFRSRCTEGFLPRLPRRSRPAVWNTSTCVSIRHRPTSKRRTLAVSGDFAVTTGIQ